MTAIAAIVLNDGAATPVAHTFGPVGRDPNGVASWVDRSSGIPLGYPALTLSVRPPVKGGSTYKVQSKIVTPILEVTSPSTATGIQPAPTKAYDLIANLELTLPARSTLQERKNIFAYLKNWLAKAEAEAAATTFEPVW